MADGVPSEAELDIQTAPEPEKPAEHTNDVDPPQENSMTEPSPMTNSIHDVKENPNLCRSPDPAERPAGTMLDMEYKSPEKGSGSQGGSRPDSAGSANTRSPGNASAKSKEREERIRQMREKQAGERQKKLDELREAQRVAQEKRERQQEERRKRLDELRRRDEERRGAVEERRRRLLEAEKERQVALLRKSQERDAKLEQSKMTRSSSRIFAFGSRTPREICEPLDRSRRSSSHTSLVRRPYDYENAHQRSHRRAASASSALRRRYAASDRHGASQENLGPSAALLPSKRFSASCTVLARKPSTELPPSSPDGATRQEKSPGLLQSRTNAPVRRYSLPAPHQRAPAVKPRSASLIQLCEALGTIQENRPYRENRPSFLVSRAVPRRPQSSQSETASSNTSDSPARKPRPRSIAGPITSAASPSPTAERTSRSADRGRTATRSRSQGAEKLREKERERERQEKARQEKENQEKSKPTPPKVNIKAFDRLSVPRKPVSQSKEPIQNKGPMKAVPLPVPILKKKTSASEKRESPKRDLPSPAGAPTEEKQEQKDAKAIEEEYKAKLAEKRRQAREKAEREAQEEKERQEELRLQEEERKRREEEEQRRLEEEQLRMMEEARRAEDERLQKAIEEVERKKKEDEERAEQERKAREEAEIKAKEEAERLEKERQERAKKEDEERLERKKRLEMIMKRVKTDSPETVQKGEEKRAFSPSPPSRTLSPSPAEVSPEEKPAEIERESPVPTPVAAAVTPSDEKPKFKSPLLQNMLEKRTSGDEGTERKFKSPLLQNMMSKGKLGKKGEEDKSASSSPTHEIAKDDMSTGSTEDLEKESQKSPDEDKDVDTAVDSGSVAKKEAANQNLVRDSDSSSSLSNQMSDTAINDSVNVTPSSVTLHNGQGGEEEHTVTVNGIKDDYTVDNPAVIDTSLSLKLHQSGQPPLASEMQGSTTSNEFEEVIDLSNSNQTSDIQQNTQLDADLLNSNMDALTSTDSHPTPLIAFEDNAAFKQESVAGTDLSFLGLTSPSLGSKTCCHEEPCSCMQGTTSLIGLCDMENANVVSDTSHNTQQAACGYSADAMNKQLPDIDLLWSNVETVMQHNDGSNASSLVLQGTPPDAASPENSPHEDEERLWQNIEAST